MEEIFPMNGGDGVSSYANNSQYQKQAYDSVKEMIQDAIVEKLEAPMKTVTIADLGCSIGPNTFFIVQHLIEAVQKLHLNTQEFHIYFNDHTTNDFNKLFASLPGDRQYYAAAVPGSFYGRLFPRASITLAHSSYSLQWLSKRPQGVVNKGRIYYVGASSNVIKAYLDQFERDMGDFLRARGEEMVRGGLMFLVVAGIPDGDSYSNHTSTFLYKFLEDSLLDLADEGVVERGARDAFNLPIYFPAVGEMRKVIEKNKCFSIERLEVIYSRVAPDLANVDMLLRSGMEGIFTAHFGSDVADKMFDKIPEKAKQTLPHVWEAAIQNSTLLFVVLKRT